MTAASALLMLAIAAPLLLLAACVLARNASGLVRVLPVAPLPALLAALTVPAGTRLQWPESLFALRFALDRPGALLLGGAAVLWITAGLYAMAYPRTRADARRFAIWWLATLTGSLGVFIAADMPSFYLFFTVVSLSAYWLIVEDGTPEARRAGVVYVAFALLGEAFLLLAFALIAAHAPQHTLAIADAVASLAASPVRSAVLVLLVLGFGVKIALVPLHVWMPLTYSAAPIPVAAVLSGAAVKAGVIGLIRFLPFDGGVPVFGEALAVLGMLGAFYGVAIGLTQGNPKTVLAYSSISQMGVIAAVLGMGLATGNRAVPLLAAFYALHHVFVKGGLFLAIGVAEQGRRNGVALVLIPAAVIALGLGGLPFTGGALAKAAIKEPLGTGVIGMLGMLSAACSTLLMLHFMTRLRAIAAPDSGPPAMLAGPWLIIAMAAIVVPWALYPSIAGGSWQDPFSLKTLWEAVWPVLLGGAALLLLGRVRGMLPSIAPGDIIVLVQPLGRVAQCASILAERLDARLRQWPVAGVMVLLCALAMMAAMAMGR